MQKCTLYLSLADLLSMSEALKKESMVFLCKVTGTVSSLGQVHKDYSDVCTCVNSSDTVFSKSEMMQKMQLYTETQIMILFFCLPINFNTFVRFYFKFYIYLLLSSLISMNSFEEILLRCLHQAVQEKVLHKLFSQSNLQISQRSAVNQKICLVNAGNTKQSTILYHYNLPVAQNHTIDLFMVSYVKYEINVSVIQKLFICIQNQ